MIYYDVIFGKSLFESVTQERREEPWCKFLAAKLDSVTLQTGDVTMTSQIDHVTSWSHLQRRWRKRSNSSSLEQVATSDPPLQG